MTILSLRKKKKTTKDTPLFLSIFIPVDQLSFIIIDDDECTVINNNNNKKIRVS